MRRTYSWALLAFALCAGVALYLWMSQPLPVLTVATWGGAYARAQADGMFHPFAAANNVDVHMAEYDGGITQLRAQVASGHPIWDVVDLELPDAVTACKDNLLASIDLARLPPGPRGQPANLDFVPGALNRCWVGSMVYSQIIAYARNRISGKPPSVLADFFDLRRFPGGRGLNRTSAKFNLELALLADGVPPKDVYRTLQSSAGLARAFAKLDTIRPAIAWWSTGAEAMAALRQGTAVFTTALNGDVFDAAAHHRPIGLIWDRQLYELEVFAVPRGDPKLSMAMEFIRFATQAPQLAAVAGWAPYGPARRSAQALIGKNPDSHIAMARYSPTAANRLSTAFPIDDAWWQAHNAAVESRWRAWLAGAGAASFAKRPNP